MKQGRFKMAIGSDNKRLKMWAAGKNIRTLIYRTREKTPRKCDQNPEICLERMRTEMKVYEQYKDEPRIIQRARFLETFLREKTIKIYGNELIIGSINSKVRGSTIVAATIAGWR